MIIRAFGRIFVILSLNEETIEEFEKIANREGGTPEYAIGQTLGCAAASMKDPESHWWVK